MAGPLRFTVAAMGPSTMGAHRTNAAAWDGRTLWLLVLEHGYAPPIRRAGQKKSELPTRTAGLWRSDDGGSTFQPVCAGEDVVPPTHSISDVRLLALSPGELHLLASARSRYEEEVPAWFARFDGTRFARREDPPFRLGWMRAGVANGRSITGVDPERGAIVAADVLERCIHQFQAGEWRKVGELPLSAGGNASVAWDAVRKVTVIVCSAGKGQPFTAARSWNGSTLADLPSPNIASHPQMELRGAPHPVSGRAVFVADDGLWQLGERSFQKLDGEPFWGHGFDLSSVPGAFTLWGAALPEGAQRAVWDGTTWSRPGRTIPLGPASKPVSTAGAGVARMSPLAVQIKDRIIVADGADPASRTGDRVRITEEFEGAHGTAFPDSFVSAAGKPLTAYFRGGKAPSNTGDREIPPTFLHGLLADPATGAIFAVSVPGGRSQSAIRADEATLWAYRGGGVWAQGPLLTAPAKAGLAQMVFEFEPDTRLLLARGTLHDPQGTDAVLTAGIGEWLDSLARRRKR